MRRSFGSLGLAGLAAIFTAMGAALLLPSGLSAQTTATAPVVAPLSVGTAFNATLITPLDAEKNRAGDPVVAETTEAVTYQRTPIFPAGTRILGHVVKSASVDRGDPATVLFVEFDKALPKGGQPVLLNAGIQAMAMSGSPAKPGTRGESPADAPERNVLPPVPPPPANGSPDQPVVMLPSSYTSTRKIVHPAGLLPAGPEGKLDRKGHFTPDSKGTFGKPDVAIYTPVSKGSHGTVIVAPGPDVRLSAGTRLLLVIQPPPAAPDTAEDSGSPTTAPEQ